MRRGLRVRALGAALATGLLLASASPSMAQVQLGGDIDGDGVRRFVGSEIGLSDDGLRLATWVHADHGSDDPVGAVRCFAYDGADWRRLGSDIPIPVPQHEAGFQIALSGDGATVAVATVFFLPPSHPSGALFGGAIEVFGFDGTDWRPRGSVTWDDPSKFLGAPLSLSTDGTRLAVSAFGRDDNRGLVEVYEFDGAGWARLGQPVEGLEAGETFGHAVELSGDGRRLVVGAPDTWNDSGDGGKVRVFEYDGSTWRQLGNDIEGGAGDYFGSELWVSPTGTHLAAVAPGRYEGDGRVQLYSLEAGRWSPSGPPIPTAPGWVGETAIDLSDDAAVLAFSTRNADRPSHNGRVHTYLRTDEGWEAIAEVVGEHPRDHFGTDVALSASGMRLAGGAMWNSDGGEYAGHIRVFELDVPERPAPPPPTPNSPLLLYPSPTTDWLEVRLPTTPDNQTGEWPGAELAVYTFDGRLVARHALGPTTELDVSGLAPGGYLARVTGLEGGGETIPFAVIR